MSRVCVTVLCVASGCLLAPANVEANVDKADEIVRIAVSQIGSARVNARDKQAALDRAASILNFEADSGATGVTPGDDVISLLLSNIVHRMTPDLEHKQKAIREARIAEKRAENACAQNGGTANQEAYQNARDNLQRLQKELDDAVLAARKLLIQDIVSERQIKVANLIAERCWFVSLKEDERYIAALAQAANSQAGLMFVFGNTDDVIADQTVRYLKIGVAIVTIVPLYICGSCMYVNYCLARTTYRFVKRLLFRSQSCVNGITDATSPKVSESGDTEVGLSKQELQPKTRMISSRMIKSLGLGGVLLVMFLVWTQVSIGEISSYMPVMSIW